jgi:hypothetical protein
MVERLREELGDETSPYTWSDDYLNNLVVEAAESLGMEFPVIATLQKDVAANQRSFSLAVGQRVMGAECPPGNPIPQDELAISSDPSSFEPPHVQSWSQIEDKVYLRNKASGSEVGVAKLVLRVSSPWERPDSSDQWGGSAADELLLIAHSAVQAWYFLEGKQARLGRAVNTKPREAAEARLAVLKRNRRARFTHRSLEEVL